MSSSWEREWRITEENQLGRPRQVMSEEDKRLIVLPPNVVQYLAWGRLSHSNGIAESIQTEAKIIQANLLDKMSDQDKIHLIEHIVWNQERLVKDLHGKI